VSASIAAIGKSSTSGTTTLYSTGLGATPKIAHIQPGPDGNLWFADWGDSAIGRITTSGTITEYTTGLPGSTAPISVTIGPDGNLWFTDYGSNEVGKFVW